MNDSRGSSIPTLTRGPFPGTSSTGAVHDTAVSSPGEPETRQTSTSVEEPASYILPIRRDVPMPSDEAAEMARYFSELASRVEVIVVDASPPDVFAQHHHDWGQAVRHIPPDPDQITTNGKVGN